jgi:hypothetical protein
MGIRSEKGFVQMDVLSGAISDSGFRTRQQDAADMAVLQTTVLDHGAAA